MKQNISLLGIGGVLIIALTFVAVQEPYVFLAVLGVSAVAGSFMMIKGWWRRSYVLTILAMGAGASHISGVAQIGGIAKVLALGLLIVVTFLTTHHQQNVWGGGVFIS